MSKNQSSVPEFDENFFANIAVPLTKDYSRLSSSPSRDQPCDSSYFEKYYPNLECDTPVKMRLPTVNRDSGDALPTLSMDNFLSSSSASDNTTVNGDQRDTGEAAPAPPAAIPKPAPMREPLKVVPNDAAPASGYDEMVDGLQKLTMFAPKAPEERLSQRRRSEQKKKQEEESKRRSALNASSKTVASANRARSISSKRAVSREPTVRAPSVPRSRHNSVTRTISAPIAPSTASGVVTRSMAARAAEATSTAPAAKPLVRRSVMPLKIAQKTPVAAVKDANAGGDRSRDRTRRTNTTGTSSATRRSVFPGKLSGASTPIAPPRRSASAHKGSAIKTTPSARPMATANRSSMLRMNAIKPTAPPTTAPTGTAPAAAPKPEVARPVPGANTVRNRVPLRVAPLTPSAATKKTALPLSGQRPVRQTPVLRSQSVERNGAQKQPPVGTPRQQATKFSREDLFNRLSVPKSSVTPQRVSHDGPTSSIRKSAVRPVPSYVHSVTKNGLPSSGGLHGIRAPSKERASAAAKNNQQ